MNIIISKLNVIAAKLGIISRRLNIIIVILVIINSGLNAILAILSISNPMENRSNFNTNIEKTVLMINKKSIKLYNISIQSSLTKIFHVVPRLNKYCPFFLIE